jgi:hypothetical protein
MALGELMFHSPALGSDVPFNVYIPEPGRFERTRFPALLLLHGRSGTFQDWVVRARLPHALQQHMAALL